MERRVLCLLQVAREFSEDKASVGGELGWKRQRDLVGPFADAAFKLDVRRAGI